MDGSRAACGEGCRVVPLSFDWCEAISQILRIRIRTSRPPFSTRGQVQHVPILRDISGKTLKRHALRFTVGEGDRLLSISPSPPVLRD